MNKNINTLTDFGAALTQHPYFADAWVQKLCYFVELRRAATRPTRSSRTHS